MTQCKKRIEEINGSLREKTTTADDRQVFRTENVLDCVNSLIIPLTNFCAIRNKLKEEAEHTRTEMISKG